MKVEERAHLVLTVVWAALFVPAVLWWSQSVPFLVFVSVYANFVGHWSSYEGAKAERHAADLSDKLEDGAT